MEYESTRYLSGIPSSRALQEVILTALREVGAVEVIDRKRAVGIIDLTVRGSAFEVWITPESKPVGSDTYERGKFDWNGRWNMRVIWSRDKELKLRPLHEKLDDALARIVAFVRNCLDVEDAWSRGEGPRVIPFRPRSSR